MVHGRGAEAAAADGSESILGSGGRDTAATTEPSRSCAEQQSDAHDAPFANTPRRRSTL